MKRSRSLVIGRAEVGRVAISRPRSFGRTVPDWSIPQSVTTQPPFPVRSPFDGHRREQGQGLFVPKPDILPLSCDVHSVHGLPLCGPAANRPLPLSWQMTRLRSSPAAIGIDFQSSCVMIGMWLEPNTTEKPALIFALCSVNRRSP